MDKAFLIVQFLSSPIVKATKSYERRYAEISRAAPIVGKNIGCFSVMNPLSVVSYAKEM